MGLMLRLNIPKRGQKVTNGDVLKAVFPEIQRTLLYHIENHMGQEWWNEPYKVGDGNENG